MSTNSHEENLLRRFKKGDKKAANEIIAKYFGRVRRAAERKLALRGGRVEGTR